MFFFFLRSLGTRFRMLCVNWWNPKVVLNLVKAIVVSFSRGFTAPCPLCMTSFNSTCLCNWSSPVHITWVMTICNFTSIQILSYCQVVNRPPRGHAQNREEFNFAWYALVVTRQHVDSAPIHANCSCRTLCSSLHRYKIPSFVRVDNFTTCYLADQHDVLLNLKVNLTLPFSEWPFAMCMHFL